jgi:hypothetical protein
VVRHSVVALLYLGITVVMTWPIAARIDRDIPSDLGDPAFVAGVMAWAAEHWLAFFTGDIAAAARFWDAPIFYPERVTIAYSEHFAIQSLLTLPAYALTRNPVLSYNLAFLATYVIGAFGMYLLVRELSGQRDGFSSAGFVAGLAFAFSPYRVATLPHLQVLSAQWMPYVFLGLHRYVRTRNTDGLVGAGAALWAQNLSSGYYMLFFSPFVVLFAVIAVWAHRAWREWRVWRDVVITGAVSVIATLPFAWPYLARTGGTRRAFAEVIHYSADVYSWLTASPLLHVWGDLRWLNKSEGYLFPGATVVVLAVIGIWSASRRSRLVAVFGAAALVLSVWLAFGPQVQISTQPVQIPALYRVLWEYLPGFNAARVPSRFATITVLALSLLAGFALLRFHPGRQQWFAALCGVLILAEGAALPLPTNRTWSTFPDAYAPPAAQLHAQRDAPQVYHYLRRLGEGTVVAHFPFGPAEREIQYGYYAMLMGTPTVNGYSGAFPPTYAARSQTLTDPVRNLQDVPLVLELDRVTHLVVHRRAYHGDAGDRIVAALGTIGWRPVADFDGDTVLQKAP